MTLQPWDLKKTESHPKSEHHRLRILTGCLVGAVFIGAATSLSGIIASGDRYVILRCTGYTTPVVQTIDADVRTELIKDIREKKLRLAMAVEFDRLQESAAVENYLAVAFRNPAKASRPPQEAYLSRARR